MTNMHLNRTARRELLTLSTIQQQAVAVYAMPGRIRAQTRMPLMVTVRSLLTRGVLESDAWPIGSHGSAYTIPFYRLTPIGWEIAHELGALAWADEYAGAVEQTALAAGMTDVRTVYQRALELYAETGDRNHLRALADAEAALRAWEHAQWMDGTLEDAGY